MAKNKTPVFRGVETKIQYQNKRKQETFNSYSPLKAEYYSFNYQNKIVQKRRTTVLVLLLIC